MGGVAKGANGLVAAQRGCAATRGLVWARAHPKQRRTAAPQCEGHGEGKAAWNGQRPSHGACQAVGRASQGKPGASVWGASGGGARSARGTITATAGPQGRHAGPRASASPRGVRCPAPAGCPSCASGSPLNSTGRTTPTAASRGTPPGCQRVAPKPDGVGCSGSSGVAHATVVPGKATPQSWSACKWPAPGSLEGVKNPETQPRSTLRRRGNGMLGQETVEQGRLQAVSGPHPL